MTARTVPITSRWRRSNGTIPNPQISSPPKTMATTQTSERLTANPMPAARPVWLLLMILIEQAGCQGRIRST